MSKYNKYASDGSGALNPFWFGEQEFQRQLDDCIYACNYLNDNLTISSDNDELYDLLLEILGDKSTEGGSKDICKIVNNQYTLEEQFDFLKAHAESEEDLKLAEKVLYYYNIGK